MGEEVEFFFSFQLLSFVISTFILDFLLSCDEFLINKLN